MGRVGRTGLAVSTALVLLLAACGSGQPPSREELSAYVEAMPPTDEAVTDYLLTQCGVEHARIGGHWWRAEEPLTSADGVSRPPRWDDPYQEGRLTLESPKLAKFEAHGDEVVFLRTADDAEPPGCK